MTKLEKLIKKHGSIRITKNYNSDNSPDWTPNDLAAAVFDENGKKLLIKNNLKELLAELLSDVSQSPRSAGYKENYTAMGIFNFIKRIDELHKNFIGNGGTLTTSDLTELVKNDCKKFLKDNTIVKPPTEKIEKIVSKELKTNQKLYNKTYKNSVTNREHHLVISGRLQAIREIQRKCHFSL